MTRFYFVYTCLCAMAVFCLLAMFSIMARAADWDIDKMNEQIEKTNVIVGGVCSGTIIDKDARLVLTAYHCITGQLVEEEVKTIDDKTGEITVKKVQKRKPLDITVNKVVNYEIVATYTHRVNIVGSDKLHDIGLLQVVDSDFKPEMAAPLAPDSYEYRRGKRIYAVGNPGIILDNTITEGIISSPQRSIEIDGLEPLKAFQHSAPTFGGNSGGSVLNDKGELIGTHSAGARATGFGFAVPISFTKDMIRKAGFGKMLEAK